MAKGGVHLLEGKDNTMFDWASTELEEDRLSQTRPSFSPNDRKYQTASGKVHRARILIVDDDACILSVMDEILTAFGYEAVTAENGEEALQKSAAGPFDLLITDFQMPRMNGVQLAARFKEAAAHMPVLMMTGQSAQTIADHAPEGLIDAVLFKPFKVEKICQVISWLLPRKSEFSD